jgi:hypothetical protein
MKHADKTSGVALLHRTRFLVLLAWPVTGLVALGAVLWIADGGRRDPGSVTPAEVGTAVLVVSLPSLAVLLGIWWRPQSARRGG